MHLNVGTLTYSSSALIGSGDETLTITNASFALSFDGDIYVPEDDEDYPTLPEVYFTDGYFVGLNFRATLKAANASPDGYIQFDNANAFYSFDGSDEFEAHIEAIALPEPSSMIMIGVSCFAVLRLRNRK